LNLFEISKISKISYLSVGVEKNFYQKKTLPKPAFPTVFVVTSLAPLLGGEVFSPEDEDAAEPEKEEQEDVYRMPLIERTTTTTFC